MNILFHDKSPEKIYSMVIFSEAFAATFTTKKFELTLKLRLSVKFFLVMVGCFISLQKSGKGPFNGNILKNKDRKYYNQKPQNPETKLKLGMSLTNV